MIRVILLLNSQHYQKLRREASTGAGSTPATPSRAIKAIKKTPGSRKSAKKLLDENIDDEENEDPDTPSKKRKRVAKKEEEELGGFNGQSALQFKMESISSDEVGVIDLEEEYVQSHVVFELANRVTACIPE